MYTKDKSNRVTLRLNPDQFDFVRKSAEIYGVSPSEFLRMVINVTMFNADSAKQGKEERRENEFANIDNFIQQ